MSLILGIFLLLAAPDPQLPSADGTAWMHPSAFRIALGMTHREAMERLRHDGRACSPGKFAGEVVVEYQAGRNLTLQFRKGRLVSMRFELVDFLPAMKGHWSSLQANLRRRLGEPSLTPEGIEVLVWNSGSPHAMAALSTLRDDEFGKQGLGFVVVRYFEPPAAAAAATAD